MNVAQDSSLLTAQELAERLRVEPNTIRRWARAGLIPVLRLPRVGLRFEYAQVRAQLRSAAANQVGGAE